MSKSESSEIVRWLPLRILSFFSAEEAKTPETLVGCGGAEDAEMATVFRSVLVGPLLECTEERKAARVPVTSVTSLAQSFFPVETTT